MYDLIAAIAAGFSAMLLYEAIGQARRFLNVAYVPVYFSFLPLEVLNRDLSVYLGDDFFLGDGNQAPRISEREARRLRARILVLAAAGPAVSAVVIPGVSALLASLYLSRLALWPAIALVAISQSYRAWLASRDFYLHALTCEPETVRRLRAVYACYILVCLLVYRETYLFARPYGETSDYEGFTSTMLAIVLWKVILPVAVLSVLSGVFVRSLAERHVPFLDEPQPPSLRRE